MYNGPGHLSKDILGTLAEKRGKTWQLVGGATIWTVKE